MMARAGPGPDPAMPGRVLLVDASSYLFRAWFGVPDMFFDRRGRLLNAVVGFARTLATLLASLARRAARAGSDWIVASEDKDLAQLLDRPGDRLWQFARRRMLDPERARDWLGIAPARLPELQALIGDAGDNIPGIPGFGPVSARAAMRRLGLPAGSARAFAGAGE